jgi:hypothetical protein
VLVAFRIFGREMGLYHIADDGLIGAVGHERKETRYTAGRKAKVMPSNRRRSCDTNPSKGRSVCAAPSKPQDYEENEGTKGGGYYLGAESSAEMQSDLGEEQAGAERAKNSNDYVPNKTKTHSSNNFTGEPSRNGTN